MSRYIVIRFGDNDFCRAMQLAAEKFLEGFVSCHEDGSTESAVDDLGWTLAHWIGAYYRAALILENNRPDLAKYKDHVYQRAPETRYLLDPYFSLSGSIERQQNLDNINDWENSEVCIIDLHTKQVEIR